MSITMSDSSAYGEELMRERFEHLLKAYEKMALMVAEQEEFNAKIEDMALKLLSEKYDNEAYQAELFYRLSNCVEKVLHNKISITDLKTEYEEILEQTLKKECKAYERSCIENVKLKKRTEQATAYYASSSSEP
ncbi:sporulation specific protein Spo2 [Schizosaccharomyces pombe]|nr:protein Spo2 [Schizosaccharomyces pombe]C6Y4C2.1 RecName: Full=Sporulation-specific protein 2 [Schizosaccharomyces pombe 972h-]CBA11512.1 sporulation specific protein Spo2 [Schizosaccharomyces pombe]|eukprot:NP_001343087.1 protein Spo2 [Schizosaccharomyces pombe]